jgi:hypothetical protein
MHNRFLATASLAGHATCRAGLGSNNCSVLRRFLLVEQSRFGLRCSWRYGGVTFLAGNPKVILLGRKRKYGSGAVL